MIALVSLVASVLAVVVITSVPSLVGGRFHDQFAAQAVFPDLSISISGVIRVKSPRLPITELK